MNTLLLSLKWITTLISFYTLNYHKIGTPPPQLQTMSQYSGKKVLLVNIATNSNRVAQIGQMQQLKNIFGDSLIVIGFPSNSFGKEPRTNAQIKTFCEANYNVTFPLADKASVINPLQQLVYIWLTTVSQNGMLNQTIKGDFQKYLVNEQGVLIGIFAPSITPTDKIIIDAVRN